jgi:hypothetical protein
LSSSGLNTTASGPTRNKGTFALVWLLLPAAIYLYSNLFYSLRTPFLLGGDQTYFWTDAQRMLFGELPYRDFFQFTPPGTDVFYFALFKLLGPRIWVTNAVVFALGLALCAICYFLSRHLMSRTAAVLTALLFLTLIYGKPLNATHHWFSVMFILIAVLVAMPRTTSSRVATAGALLGVAAFFTHSHAIAAATAYVIFLTIERWQERQSLRVSLRRMGFLAAGFIAAWLICNSYFLITVGFKQLWYWQITFVSRYVEKTPGGAFFGLPEVPTLHRLPTVSQYLLVYALIIVIYPLFLWRCWTRRNKSLVAWRKETLLCLIGLALAVEVSLSLNWLRLFAVSMPALILAITLVEKSGRRSLMCFVWAATIFLGISQLWSKHHHAYNVAELPGGRAALSLQEDERCSWLMQHTKSGDFFFEPLAPSLYLPLALRSPAFVEGLGPNDQTRPEFVDCTIHEFQSKPVRYVLWSPHTDEAESLHLAGDHLGPFRTYLRTQYAHVWTFSNRDEIWEKK